MGVVLADPNPTGQPAASQIVPVETPDTPPTHQPTEAEDSGNYEPITIETIDRLQYIGQAGLEGELLFLDSSPDGSAVVLGSREEIIVVKPAKPVRPVSFWPDHPSPPIALGTNGDLVAIGYETGEIKLWSVETAEQINSFEMMDRSLLKVEFDSRGELLAGISFEGSIRIWEVETGRIVGMLNQDETLTEFKFSSDGTSIALLVGGEVVQIRRMETGAQSQQLEWSEPTGPIYWIEFDQNWERMVWVSRSIARLQHLSNPEQGLLLAHEFPIHDIDFSPDGLLLASSSEKTIDEEIRSVVQFWDTASGEETFTILHADVVTKIEFSSEGSVLFCGLRNGEVRAHDPNTGEKRNYLSGHNQSIEEIYLLSDGTFLATVSRDGELRLWAIAD